MGIVFIISLVFFPVHINFIVDLERRIISFWLADLQITKKVYPSFIIMAFLFVPGQIIKL